MAVRAVGREMPNSAAMSASTSTAPGARWPSSTRARRVSTSASTTDTVRSVLTTGTSCSGSPGEISQAAARLRRPRGVTETTLASDCMTSIRVILSDDIRFRTRESHVFQPEAAPVGGSLALSALVAALPLITLFVLLGALKWKAWQAGLTSLVVAIVVAVVFFGMPASQALITATEGGAFGLFPIIYIVLTAIWIFRLTELTGYDLVLRRAFGSVSPDQRVQAILIAFCFGALLEALAGFGTPVAVTAVMLMAVGIRPVKAAAVALVANTAPVAFGAVAVPITTLGKITGLDPESLGAMVGRQTPILAVFVPLILVFMVDGRRGVRETWLPAVVAGARLQHRAVPHLELLELPGGRHRRRLRRRPGRRRAAAGAGRRPRCSAPTASPPPTPPAPAPPPSRWASPPVAGSTGSAGTTTVVDEDDPEPPPHLGESGGPTTGPVTGRETLMAFAPYLIVVALFTLVSFGPLKTFLDTHSGWKFQWPGLEILNAAGKTPAAATFNLNVFTAAGTVLLVAGILTALVYRVQPRQGRCGRSARSSSTSG